VSKIGYFIHIYEGPKRRFGSERIWRGGTKGWIYSVGKWFTSSIWSLELFTCWYWIL